MRRVAQIMGMPISVDIPGSPDESVFEAVFTELKAIDEQFSPFMPDSELSRFKRGELTADTVSVGMKDIMKACLEAEVYTDGYFSARYSRGFDPTGYVKGWSIEQASEVIKDSGHSVFCLSLGGDVNARSDSAKTWRVGIQDPANKHLVMERIVGKNFAVATSGNYERGDHIINPKSGRPARELLSLTVVGPDIIRADILATAAYAMGTRGLDFIVKKAPGYEALVISKDGNVRVSKGMDKLLEV